MNFKVYLVQKKLEKFYLQAIAEYQKRLGRYCKIELIQVKTEAQLLKSLSEKCYKIKLRADGVGLSSECLASKLQNYALSANSDVAFIVNAPQIEADETLSLSPMDMEGGLEAAILFEQIYRAYRIINGEPYHK